MRSGECMASARDPGEAPVNGDGDKADTLEVAAEPAAEPLRRPRPRPAPEGHRDASSGAILDEALDRMERRVVGDERPIPLPWSNVSAALGGGLWGGTLVTLVGDTGSGKTQWALQLSVHAAEYGVPVCYVGPDSGRGPDRGPPAGPEVRPEVVRPLRRPQRQGDAGHAAHGLRAGHEGAAVPHHRAQRAARPAPRRARHRGMDAAQVPRGEAGNAPVPDGPRLRADRERA